MGKRITALVLITCCIFTMPYASAVVDEAPAVESGYYEPEVPLAEGDTGVPGLEVEGDSLFEMPVEEAAPEEIPEPEQTAGGASETFEGIVDVSQEEPEIDSDIDVPQEETETENDIDVPQEETEIDNDIDVPQEEAETDSDIDVPLEEAEIDDDIDEPLEEAEIDSDIDAPLETPDTDSYMFGEGGTDEGMIAEDDADEWVTIEEPSAVFALPSVYAAADVYGTAAGLTINRSRADLVPGSSVDLEAACNGRTVGTICWSSDDESVAVVDGQGRVTAQGIGSTVITASDESGMTAECSIYVIETADFIAFDCDTYYLGVGETADAPGITVNDGIVSDLSGYTLQSSKKSCVRVNADGTLTGRKKGSATITVTGPGGLTDTVKVTVKKAPSKVTASPKSITIGLGERVKVGYKLPSGSYGRVTYKSLDESRVSADTNTGVITGLALGETKVKISTYNKKSCTLKVKVAGAPESIALSASELVMGAGQSTTLKATLNAGSAGRISWETGDPSVATVSDGKIKAVAPGETVVTARTYVDGVLAECTVTVKPAPASVSLPSKKIYIGTGEKVQLKPDVGDSVGGFKYSSKKKEYASVSASGVVKGKKKGSTTITVKTYNGKKTTLKVVVGKAPKKITAKNAVLGLNETGVLGYKLPSGSYGDVTFTSLTPECVVIDPDTGAMEAVGTGNATIQLETYNGKKAKATVQVFNAPERIDLSQNQLVIGVGQTVSISAAVNEGAAGAITWESADAGTATVKNGSITGKAAGTVAITARTYVEGVTGVLNVLVKPAPVKVTLPSKKVYIGVGDSYLLEPDVGDSVGGYKFSSSAKKIAKVSGDGVVKGVKAGTAKITVKTYNGKKATVTVVVRKAPSKITPVAKYVELGAGETCTVGYKLPKNTSATVAFASMDESILRVDSVTGKVTTLKAGQADVRMRTHNGKEAFTTVKVYPAPEWVKVNCDALYMGVEQSFRLCATIPEGSRSAIFYASSDPNVAKVTSDGVVTANSKGTAYISVKTCNKDAWAEIPVKVVDAPPSVTLATSAMELNVDETIQLEPVIPEGTMTAFTYTSSDTSLARVTPDGKVTPRMRGSVTITVTTHNGKSAQLQLKINDPWFPESVTLDNLPGVMWAGGTEYQMKYSVTPADARPLLKWSSSKPEVASVDQNGLIKPLSYGYTTIRAVSEKNSEIDIKFTLTVQEENRILVIPERTTQESGISANLAKIDAIRASAIAQVDALRSKGTIKAKDASKRKSMINNIFRDYAFAWKTPSLQKYWRKANSEGGAKDFKADRVYYGMPYISGSGTNRVYNAAKALKEKRFTDSGNGYYLLNKKKLLNGKYVGNDCSGLVNTAIWGTSSSHTSDRTVEIAQSKSYKTIKSFNKMRPGDLICLPYRHVVMFLYYADQDKSKIMVIENGGGEAGTNTVHCAVHNVSYYKKQGYKVRRLASLG